MPLKDMLTLKNIRRDFRFFIHRFLIGILLSYFIFESRIVDPYSFFEEAQDKHFNITIVVLIASITAYLIYKTKPKYENFKKIQNELILFSKTMLSVCRGLYIGVLSSIIYFLLISTASIADAAAISFNILTTLELMTSAYYGMNDFEY